jgi:hypothetical protein
MEVDTKEAPISKSRLTFGAIVFGLGFLSPLLIPLVTRSELSTTWKATISGLLAFGIPEIFILIAVAILGKEGYAFLKSKIGTFLKPFAPADKVSKTRYNVGLFFFFSPLLIGWASPYLLMYFSELESTPLQYYIMGDVVFILSFFLLGGDFWDKFRSLFKQDA